MTEQTNCREEIVSFENTPYPLCFDAYNKIVDVIPGPCSILIIGAAGSGKTTAANMIGDAFNSLGVDVSISDNDNYIDFTADVVTAPNLRNFSDAIIERSQAILVLATNDFETALRVSTASTDFESAEVISHILGQEVEPHVCMLKPEDVMGIEPGNGIWFLKGEYWSRVVLNSGWEDGETAAGVA
jgi:hypothetical protein